MSILLVYLFFVRHQPCLPAEGVRGRVRRHKSQLCDEERRDAVSRPTSRARGQAWKRVARAHLEEVQDGARGERMASRVVRAGASRLSPSPFRERRDVLGAGGERSAGGSAIILQQTRNTNLVGLWVRSASEATAV